MHSFTDRLQNIPYILWQTYACIMQTAKTFFEPASWLYFDNKGWENQPIKKQIFIYGKNLIKTKA